MICVRCGVDTDPDIRLFCAGCGKLLEAGSLRRVRLMGPIGVAHSNSSKIDEFFATGDPNVFSRHGA